MRDQHQKIAGYRDLSQAEIDAMNALKALEARCGEALAEVERLAKELPFATDGRPDPYEETRVALRWAALAQNCLETGFMYAIKAIARPTNGLGRKSPA